MGLFFKYVLTNAAAMFAELIATGPPWPLRTESLKCKTRSLPVYPLQHRGLELTTR